MWTTPKNFAWIVAVFSLLAILVLAGLSPQSSVLCPGLPLALAAPAADQSWAKPLGQLDIAVIPESSGIDKSDRYEGIYWTHNDSGNPAELLAVKLDGALVARFPVTDAPNIDWEDIAVADGHIYVADIGNNFGWFSTRTIYKFAEPEPYASDPMGAESLSGGGLTGPPQKPIATFRFRYPDKPFDAESLVVAGDRLYIIRKGGGRSSTLFRLTPGDTHTMTLTPVQELNSTGITGADLSPDGRYLAVTSIWLLSIYPVNEDLTPRTDEKPRYVRYPFAGGVEACCFDGSDIILTAESGAIHRIPQDVIQTQRPFGRPK